MPFGGTRPAIALALGIGVFHSLAGTAAAEERTLRIFHIHTKETINITYKRNGRFDEAALAKLSRFLRDWRNQEEIKIDPRLFDILWEVYREVGATEPIKIISAYRSPQTNAMLRRRSRGVAQFSQHMLGRAIDFTIPGVPLESIRHAGLRLQRGGVGFYPSSGAPFVHVDVGSVRHWPRMAPEAYARVMRDSPRVRTAIASLGQPRQTTPDATASAPPQRNWLSRMWSRNSEPEHEADTAAAPVRRGRGAPAQEAAPPARTQTASAVPMPRARPGASEPAQVAQRRMTPAEIVQARGMWQANDVVASAEPAPTPPPQRVATADNPRLVWQTGPQPVAAAAPNPQSTVVAKRTPVQRPRVVASAAPETTASVPWPMGSQQDRVPREVALSYAAETTQPPPARPQAMGALRPAAAAAQAQAARPRQIVRAAAAATAPRAPLSPLQSRLGENPWLRGVILAPSMHAAVDVTTLGPPNFRMLTPLMHKPRAAVWNQFADSADFGLNPARFQGAAVGGVPTVTFGTATASLR